MKRLFLKSYTVCMAVFAAFCSSALVAVAVNGTMHLFSSGEVLSASRINTNFRTLKSAIESITIPNAVPPGSIIAWHRDISGAAAPLPKGWVECDGSTVDDPQSPLDGTTVPDLNGQTRFLRGGGTSGVLQADAFQGHRHFRNPDRLPESTFQTGTGAQPWVGLAAVVNYSSTGGVDRDPLFGWPRVATETRPMNMSVIWIMKIK